MPIAFGPLALALAALPLAAQSSTPSPGVTLSDPVLTTDATIYDSQGQAVLTWTFTAEPGAAAYLDADGDLIRAYDLGFPGIAVGGGIQKVAFDGAVLWDYVVPLA